jgi:transcriptional regulator with XRE-family HTH domain
LSEQELGSLSFAGLLRRLRGDAKLTQEELAEAAGLSPRAVSDLERGIHRTARKDSALLLARALGLTESGTVLFVAAARGRTPAVEVLATLRSSGRQDSARRPADPKPRAWNVPARNPAFTGRDDLLAALRERLEAGRVPVAQALYGMGGVGKSQLAVEYAHRFAAGYDVIWWIDAEQDGLIGDQVVSLGLVLGCVPAGADTETVRVAVLAELRRHDSWLLIFDNAQTAADVAPWLPGGSGHVLITSRRRGWDEIATPIEVDVLSRAETIEMLQRRIPALAETDAGRLGAELGDLPLAIAQAAGFIADTGTQADQYLDLLRTRGGQLLDRSAPGSYPRSLAAATALISDRLANHDPAAAELASLCAFLAPEPIPEYLFISAAAKLPGELAASAADPLAWRQTLAHLSTQSLARIDHRGLQMHRLTQAILRDRLTPARAAAMRACTEVILAAGDPGDPPDPRTWARWAQLMPHVLAADLGTTESPALRELVRRVCWYLIERGEARTARDLMSGLRQQWRARLGPDHRHTLMAGHYLAWSLWELGHYAESRDLNRDTLERHRSVLGEDHPDTLNSAHNLAMDLRMLGDAGAARDLDQDTLERYRRSLGHDHLAALRSANNLAADLRALGEAQAARDLDQDTLERRRHVLGHDHPDTLNSAYNLAMDLRMLGDAGAARNLDQDTLERRRHFLGDDHPDTLKSASNLAADMRALGEAQAARDLDQDTLERRRRVLGDDHPDTLSSARTVALNPPG